MEKQGSEKYIKCSTCKCKYINDDEHVEKEFGYNRLNERYKCCVKCRAKRLAYKYSSDQIDQHKKYNAEKITCSTCGASVCRNRMRNHEKDKGCSRNDVKKVY